jgi:hypothetical protein
MSRIKEKQPRMKKLVQRIIQWRLIGYIVIGISLHQLGTDTQYLIFQMFLLILFTELQSRGISKKKLDNLKEELNIQQEYTIEDRKSLDKQAIQHMEKEDALKVKKDIEENYKPR